MPETDFASLFTVFTDRFNDLAVPYMVTGSVASILFGEPRMTHDVDVVLELDNPSVMEKLSELFPIEEFYCPPHEVIRIENSRRRHGHFNLIHHKTGFKADVYLKSDDPLHVWGLAHRRLLDLEGHPIWLAPPEYVIVRKLEFFKEGGSEKHIRDIRAMLAVSKEDIDREQLEKLIVQRQLREVWKQLET